MGKNRYFLAQLIQRIPARFIPSDTKATLAAPSLLSFENSF